MSRAAGSAVGHRGYRPSPNERRLTGRHRAGQRPDGITITRWQLQRKAGRSGLLPALLDNNGVIVVDRRVDDTERAVALTLDEQVELVPDFIGNSAVRKISGD